MSLTRKQIALGLIVLAAGVIVLVRWRRARFSVADPPGILREVKLLKELVTVRYSIQKVAGLREDTSPISSESILLIVQAKVHGGIDLGEMTDHDIRVGPPGSVSLTLPRARILHIYLDEKNTQVWDRTKTWWTPWVPYDNDLEKKARMAALKSVEREALDMGILEEAQRSAETLIRGLLHPLGFDHVDFPKRST